MSRIRRMLVALVAVMAIGAAGASAAQAANSGTVSIPAGACDVTFDRSAWSGGSGSWSSNISNVETDVSGDCDVDDVSGTGVVTKNSDGTASFSGTFSFQVLSGFVTCTYSGSMTGTWSYNGSGQKVFDLSGTVNRVSGSALFCPASSSADLDAVIDP